ncbi:MULTISPECIES: hypothetical protein [unclassified Mesorhizobium]|uniref:hypothetical protein n=1 Tax=unclassified Mesorhizobium TaxID=325217 RepID=UPI0003CE1D0D|nr:MULTISPECIES: hypothetical protein [unclassified Mesorhizobium]ESY51722.1 hypothetical protein X745_22725 [Mesorhizobium sp. LNJC374B00]ESY58771.1 hypothetical protein X744_17240 [Mesorhizobium sp. LNJC372A00]WJI79010.1 hypothetical protein NLY34_19265 [Mesorhizobium sp. C374B]WJI85546.1 hypothetical protein NLY42_21665 [Mesorhizobium sp. C372A]
MMARIHGLIAEAEQVIYLGFSYGTMNLELLTVPEKGKKKSLVLGTSIGISDANAFSSPRKFKLRSDQRR